MFISNNGNLDALLEQYKEGRDKGKRDWGLWEKLLQKHDEAVKAMDWDVLEKFAEKSVLQDFKMRKAA